MILTQEQLTILIAGLRRMTQADYKPNFPRNGICSNIESDTGIYNWTYSSDYNNAVKSWPKFSGETAYPIEGEFAYWTILDKWTGQHLIARQELAAHIASEFEKHLKASKLSGNA